MAMSTLPYHKSWKHQTDNKLKQYIHDRFKVYLQAKCSEGPTWIHTNVYVQNHSYAIEQSALAQYHSKETIIQSKNMFIGEFDNAKHKNHQISAMNRKEYAMIVLSLQA